LQIAVVPFKWVEAASWQPGPGREALQRVNPLAQIPTLVLDDGTAMTESAAILIWLGLRYPASGLLPLEPAQAIRGLVFIAANCYAAIGVIDYPPRFCSGCDEATGERIRAGTRSRLHEYWEIFADQFPQAPFLGGKQLGALDLLAAVVSRWSGARPHLAAARPALHAMLQRVEADPRTAATFARHWPPGG
jgi:GST-like protein